MFDDFTTIDYILSYPGMIIAISVLTQFFKNFFNVATKYVALAFAGLLCVLAAWLMGDWSTSAAAVQTVVVWLVNWAIVWLAAMKGFETLFEKGPVVVNVPKYDNNDNELYKTAFDAAVLHLDEFKDVRIRRIQEK